MRSIKKLLLILVILFLSGCAGASADDRFIPTGIRDIALEPTSSPSSMPTHTALTSETETISNTPTPNPTVTNTMYVPLLVGTPIVNVGDVISPGNADRLTEYARWGKGTAVHSAFSPDGQTLAVASARGIYLFDTNSFEQKRWFETKAAVYTVAFTPDGKLLAAGGVEGLTVERWEISDEAVSRNSYQVAAEISAMAFSPDGRILAVGLQDTKILLWDVVTGKETCISNIERYSLPATTISFSHDGKIVAADVRNGFDMDPGPERVMTWDVETGKEIRTLIGNSPFTSVAFSPDNAVLASGSFDSTIRLWDLSTGKELRTLTGHTGPVNTVVFSPDGEQLVSGSDDHTNKIWDVKSGKLLRTLRGHLKPVKSIALSPDGMTLSSISNDAEIKLWHVEQGKEMISLGGFSGRLWSLAFSPDGSMLASGSEYTKVKILDASNGLDLFALNGGENYGSNKIAFSPDGKVLAASVERQIKLWDTQNGKEIRTIVNQLGYIGSIAFSPDGKTLATGMAVWEESIILWDWSTGRMIRIFHGPGTGTRTISFSPDGRLLASIADDTSSVDRKNEIKVWDIATGREIASFTNSTEKQITDMKFSPDGKTIYGARGGQITSWDVSTGEELGTLDGFDGVTQMVFSPDRRLLASCVNWVNKLWDFSNGKELFTLIREDGSRPRCGPMDFSPDGRVLANGSRDDGTISLWEIVK